MKLKSHLTCCRCNDEWPISLLAVMPAPDEDFYCGHCTDEMFWESRENPDATKTCSKYEPRTAEEIEAQEQTIAAALNAYNAIWTRETELCPECGATVENLKQVGRSVYTRPCGHRIGQGRVPEVWK